MNTIDFNKSTIHINGKSFDLGLPIKRAKMIKNLVIVIFDLDQVESSYSQIKNCKAYDKDGNLIWVADHPTNTSSDFYQDFNENNLLWNFCGLLCQLDFSTGKILNTHFTK